MVEEDLPTSGRPRAGQLSRPNSTNDFASETCVSREGFFIPVSEILGRSYACRAENGWEASPSAEDLDRKFDPTTLACQAFYVQQPRRKHIKHLYCSIRASRNLIMSQVIDVTPADHGLEAGGSQAGSAGGFFWPLTVELIMVDLIYNWLEKPFAVDKQTATVRVKSELMRKELLEKCADSDDEEARAFACTPDQVYWKFRNMQSISKDTYKPIRETTVSPDSVPCRGRRHEPVQRRC